MAEISSLNRSFILSLLSSGKRVDGRGLNEPQGITAEIGGVTTANGSAMVRIGHTMVVTGIKMNIGVPYSESPSRGVLGLNVELCPMASPEFEVGPLKPDAIEISRTLERAIRGSKIIDLEKLCVSHGEKAWVIHVDIHVLDLDGDLYEVAFDSLILALYSLTLPPDVEEFRVGLRQLREGELPTAATFVKAGGYLMVNPTFEEESASGTRVFMVMDRDSSLCMAHKSKGGSFSREEIFECIERTREISTGRRKAMCDILTG